MKLFIKLLVTILVIGVLLPFTILKGKDGSPLLSFGDLKLPESNIPLADKLKSPADGDNLGSGEVIYNWTDDEGNIQFSNSPPPTGVEYTARDYDPNLNVIQAVEVPVDEPEEELNSESEEQITSTGDIGNQYSPEKIDKLFEDTKNIEKLLNQRIKNQEAILGQ